MTLDTNLGYRNYRSNKSISPLLRGFIWGGAFTLTAAISGFLGIFVALKSPIPVSVDPVLEKLDDFKNYGFSSFFLPTLKQPLNILVMGVDKVPNATEGSPQMFAGRSDTMLLVRVQPEDRSVRVISIPRDSRMEYPNGRYDKINSANARGGVELVTGVVQNNFNNVPIHNYVRVTTDALKEMIDLVGGVEVYVPKDMYYKDVSQGLEIDLKQGLQTLNGEEAEQFSRYRSDSLGDIGRVQRQQVLIKALKDKLKSPTTIARIPQLIGFLEDYIDTDLTNKEMITLANFGRGLKKENIKQVILPGRFSQSREYNTSYWLISEKEKNQILDRYFDLGNDLDNDLVGDSDSIKQLRIVIQNGTSNPDLPKATARFLRKNDFRNVSISRRSSSPTRTTQIIPQKGDINSAEILQQTLDFADLDISSTGDISSDLTIRVGEDAEKLLDDTFVR